MKYIVFLSFGVLSVCCSKSDFLDKKPQKSLLEPTTLEHYQAILDHDGTMNGAGALGLTPQLGESGSDDYYLLDKDFESFLLPQTQQYYIWSEQPYLGQRVYDWEFPYKAILHSNIVLDGLQKLESTKFDKSDYGYIKGQALFHRAHMYHQLAQVFSPPFSPDGQNDGFGLVWRMTSDINEQLTMATVGEVYDQIIADLKESIPLLTTNNLQPSRPSRQAAYGLLARVYLTMQDYPMALLYADSCLQLQDDLCDFNMVDVNATAPFRGVRFANPINKEVLFYSVMLSGITDRYPTSPFAVRIDTLLYDSYDENDLRKSAFFHKLDDGVKFKGSYNFYGYEYYFSGIAVDEILLISAECNARIGNLEQALEPLNRLLLNRHKTDTYLPISHMENDPLLGLILAERRKELVFRGLRWSDLRRLNAEGKEHTLRRKLQEREYTLEPNDGRWTWPLPLEVTVRP